jgi:hypothetical protein
MRVSPEGLKAVATDRLDIGVENRAWIHKVLSL